MASIEKDREILQRTTPPQTEDRKIKMKTVVLPDYSTIRLFRLLADLGYSLAEPDTFMSSLVTVKNEKTECSGCSAKVTNNKTLCPYCEAKQAFDSGGS